MVDYNTIGIGLHLIYYLLLGVTHDTHKNTNINKNRMSCMKN